MVKVNEMLMRFRASQPARCARRPHPLAALASLPRFAGEGFKGGGSLRARPSPWGGGGLLLRLCWCCRRAAAAAVHVVSYAADDDDRHDGNHYVSVHVRHEGYPLVAPPVSTTGIQ